MRTLQDFLAMAQDWLPVKDDDPKEGGRKAAAPGEPRKGGRLGATGSRPGKSRFPAGYFLFLGGLLLLFNLLIPRPTLGLLDYSEFKHKIRSGEILRVEIQPGMILGRATAAPDTSRASRASRAADTGKVYRAVPVEDPGLLALLDSAGVEYTARVDAAAGVKTFFFNWVLPALFFIGLWMLLMPRLGGGGGGAGLFALGKSKAHVVAEGEVGITFDDVAGVDEAKDELKEIVDFLRTPAKYLAIGGKIPKGVLLVGPPGTGKTLMAKAVAGEAKVPFFRISGSDFVEMIVGVGAARVRDLFKQAREKAPCIIFIDELDAIGKSRTSMMGGHDEREQTLNQLLVEMDGFDTRAGVIILAATNRPEILDPALLRPGRFDRQVVVDKPDLAGRKAILERHAQGVKMAPEVDLEALARRTPGFAGADLANIINEGALQAVKADHTQVTQADLEEAVERVMAGLRKKNRVMTPRDKERVAHHETGHALVAAFTPGVDPVDKVSIIPRGLGALGYTLQLPTEERYLLTEGELLARIDVLLGGRAAEEIIYGEVSTGAAHDLGRATEIARQMVMD
ncbi:MAG TPA: ATP-dependent zinc metalloprotease FtsH, partial [Geothrix sp.]|nr:ATP-dependent zinc metalloprotease FtsH [Geothrix sp.]